MHEDELRRGRITASIAATAISLACGTNYVYSAWSPQFAERLKLSSTESNLVGLFGNLGMYTLGFFIGMFVDTRGPRPAVLIGAVLLAIGYFPLHEAYDLRAGSVPLLCFFSYLTGLGGCTVFAAAVKTSALNWPHHRGTATAFPLAAYGLSAFFFSMLGSIFFPGNPSDFLMLLAAGTSGMSFIGFFFLKVYPDTTTYQAIPNADGTSTEDMAGSQRLRRVSSHEAKAQRYSNQPGVNGEPGTSSATANAAPTSSSQSHIIATDPILSTAAAEAAEPTRSHHHGHVVAAADNVQFFPVTETSSLLSASDSSEIAKHVGSDANAPRNVDLRGLKLLGNIGFWQLWMMMALLAGIGLMTINNIGNDAKALWKHYDESKDEAFLVGRQQMHVSILSVLSFSGRLLSGVGSDLLVRRLHASRLWFLVLSSALFIVAQILALNITNPHLLVLVSATSGLAYGSLFGVFPSIVAETFGIHGFSQNWGFITMAPSISGNIFNLFYGITFDSHSVVEDEGHRVCHEGLACYQAAYWMTLAAGFAGLGITLWTIRYQRQQHLKELMKANEED